MIRAYKTAVLPMIFRYIISFCLPHASGTLDVASLNRKGLSWKDDGFATHGPRPLQGIATIWHRLAFWYHLAMRNG